MSLVHNEVLRVTVCTALSLELETIIFPLTVPTKGILQHNVSSIHPGMDLTPPLPVAKSISGALTLVVCCINGWKLFVLWRGRAALLSIIFGWGQGLNDASQAVTSQVLQMKSLAFTIFNVTNDSLLCLWGTAITCRWFSLFSLHCTWHWVGKNENVLLWLL